MVTCHLIYGLKYYTINTVMRYHMIYKKGIEKPFYGTIWNKMPAHINDPEKLLEITTDSDNDWDFKQILTWQLNDLPLTQKFIDAYIKLGQHSSRWQVWGGEENQSDERPPGYKWGLNRDVWWTYEKRIDIYKANTIQDFLDSRTKMNELIDHLGIDSKLKLNDKEITDHRIDSLNRLHEIFEEELVEGYKGVADKTQAYKDYAPYARAWEAVNYIVHMNEKCQGMDHIHDDYIRDYMKANDIGYDFEKLLDDTFEYNTTFATHYIPPGDIIKLYQDYDMVDEDYEHFTLEKNGQDLFLDFGTVGKDLYSCSTTNDIQLASEERQVSQQITYNTWVHYNWETRDHKKSLDTYNKWIAENNIKDNIDLSQPKFTPGRHPLSNELISHPDMKDPKIFYNNIVKRTPIIDGFVITDDNNKSIL